MRGGYAQLSAALLLAALTAMTVPRGGRRATLVLAGDVMLGRTVTSSHSPNRWSLALASLRPHVSRADLAFANLESPLTHAPSIGPGYDLRAPPESVAALRTAGFDLLSLANNHALDSGPRGLKDTLAALRRADLRPVGPGSETILLEIDGRSLAWLAFDDSMNPLDLEAAASRVRAARQVAQGVVLSIHWGHEFVTRPTERQRQVAAALAGAGADLIVGHHPHVLQPVEWLHGAGRGRPTLVAYSLGNALFDQGAPPAARQGALLRVELGPLGAHDPCAIPFQIDPNVWRPATASASTEAFALMRLGLPRCKPAPLR
jgi:poly-gamma-glutamate synthesis protein (capsule biosynthesis protein)